MSASTASSSGSVAPIHPSSSDSSASNLEIASRWNQYGFDVIPLVQNTKIPAVKWDTWRNVPSVEKIPNYWAQYPNHEVAFKVGDHFIVLVADSPESLAALFAIEKKFDHWPNLVVKTANGAHHYFRRGAGHAIGSAQQGTAKRLDHIDVLTGDAIVPLPPSSGYELALSQATNASELIEASQDFIGAVGHHNITPMFLNGSELVTPLPDIYSAVNSDAEESLPDQAKASSTPLDRFSIRDKLDAIERQVFAAVFILGRLALMGQFTIFFAAPNTGKTLLVFYLLTEAIRQGTVDAAKVYYLNMDDNMNGLLEKLRIATEYDFHILAEGHEGFSVSHFIRVMNEMIENNQAFGVVIILDTLKKFVNVMDKTQSSRFNQVIRRFVMKGGTVIALAHTNKSPGQDGKPVYGGTTDMRDDADCVYTLRAITPLEGNSNKVVEFENIKSRGDVAMNASYQYSCEHGISYTELLSSVLPLDDKQLAPIKQAAATRVDAELIAAAENCIRLGINSRMKLRDAIAKRTGVSLRTSIQAIDKYTGDDPTKHRWHFSVRERGAKVYELLNSALPVPKLEIARS